MKARSRPATARNLYLDIALAVGFLVALKPYTTGLTIHEWLGLAVGGGLVTHALLHGRWIAAITGRWGAKLPIRTRVCYVLDALLMVSFGTILVTGLLMSQAVVPALGLATMPSLTLASLHGVVSWIALGALGMKLALHAEWVRNAVRVHVLRRPAIARQSVSPARTNPTVVPAPDSGYTRRQILSAGVLGLGAVLLYGLWSEKDPGMDQAQAGAAIAPATQPSPSTETFAPAAAASSDGEDTDDWEEDSDDAEDEEQGASGRTSIKTQTMATATSQSAAAAGSAVGAGASTPAPAPTATPVATAAPRRVASRCPYGLVNDPYPGRCGRYRDSNGNGYCDLSQSA